MTQADSKNENFKYIVDEEFEEFRIDKYLSELNPKLSRSYIQKLIKDGLATVNGAAVKPGLKLSEGDLVSLEVPALVPLDLEPWAKPLDIYYEDDDFLIVNKPKGMVVHPAPGHLDKTLVNALLYHCKDKLSGINGVLRPGIVHRIDKDTSGLLVVCKNNASHNAIAEQFKVHSGNRIYYALVHGVFKDNEPFRVEKPIGRSKSDRKKMAVVEGGKDAISIFTPLESFKGKYTLVECKLMTGRTHQIRVHMASIGHPLVGDTVYSGYDDSKLTKDGQVLHAAVLGLVHPTTKEYMEFKSELPEYFKALLDKLRG